MQPLNSNIFGRLKRFMKDAKFKYFQEIKKRFLKDDGEFAFSIKTVYKWFQNCGTGQRGNFLDALMSTLP